MHEDLIQLKKIFVNCVNFSCLIFGPQMFQYSQPKIPQIVKCFNTSRLNTTTGFYICHGARRFSTKRSIVDNCVLNMLLALKCQNSTVLRFLCKLYSRDSRYSEYASGSQYTKMLNISGILIWQSFTGYIDRVSNIPRVLYARVLDLFWKQL